MAQTRLQHRHRRDRPTITQMGFVSSWYQVRCTQLSISVTLMPRSLDNWNEWARRQYQQKTPSRPNPYGEEEEPNNFRDFHVFQKLRTLHQLSVWAFWNPDRIRQAMPDIKETDQYYDWVRLLRCYVTENMLICNSKRTQ